MMFSCWRDKYTKIVSPYDTKQCNNINVFGTLTWKLPLPNCSEHVQHPCQAIWLSLSTYFGRWAKRKTPICPAFAIRPPALGIKGGGAWPLDLAWISSNSCFHHLLVVLYLIVTMCQNAINTPWNQFVCIQRPLLSYSQQLNLSCHVYARCCWCSWWRSVGWIYS